VLCPASSLNKCCRVLYQGAASAVPTGITLERVEFSRRLYTSGTLRKHPFLDGNKRTGFLAGILFLELNGYRFVASEEDAAQAVLQLADGTLDESDYSGFLRGNVVRRKK
jgi:prophage maintenance system killer protein